MKRKTSDLFQQQIEPFSKRGKLGGALGGALLYQQFKGKKKAKKSLGALESIIFNDTKGRFKKAKERGITSSAIQDLDYSEFTKVLTIKFHDNAVRYDYVGVSPELYARFIKADSRGEFYNQFIRDQHSVNKKKTFGKKKPKPRNKLGR